MNTAAVKETVKKGSSRVVKFASGGAGFGVGLWGMGKLQALTGYLPSFIPEVIRKMAPGLAVMFLSYYASTKLKNDKLQALALGVGFSGGADAVRRLVGSFMPGVKSVVPGLDGPQGAEAINVGDFQMPYYWENAFQGLRGPFAMQGFSMQGPGAFALNGGAYALSGRRRAKGLKGFSMQGPGAYALN